MVITKQQRNNRELARKKAKRRCLKLAEEIKEKYSLYDDYWFRDVLEQNLYGIGDDFLLGCEIIFEELEKEYNVNIELVEDKLIVRTRKKDSRFKNLSLT